MVLKAQIVLRLWEMGQEAGMLAVLTEQKAMMTLL
jgi:hypothetical protein